MPKTDRDLFAAIKEDNGSDVERPVAKGANVNVKYDQFSDGLPPLAGPPRGASTNAAEFQISRGANVNAGNLTQHAASRGRLQPETSVGGLLVRKGGDVNARTDIGWTPLHKAMEKLAMAPANETPPGDQVAKVVRAVELLLASGAAVNAQGSIFGAPIHMAALTGQKALVQMLIDKGADVSSRSDDGQTPLYQAAKKGSTDVAELLLARRADVNARTKSGYTR